MYATVVQITAQTRFGERFIERGRFRGDQQALEWWRRRSGRRWSGRRRGRRQGSFATTGAGPGARACPPADLPQDSRCRPCTPAHLAGGLRGTPTRDRAPARAHPHPPRARGLAEPASPSAPPQCGRPPPARRPRPWPPPGHAGRTRGGGLAAVGAPAREGRF